MEYPGDLTESFEALSTFLSTPEDVDATLSRIATLSVAVIPHCDFAGVSLVEPGGIRTVGHTSELVKEIDGIQYETGEGPCLSAIKDPRASGHPATYEIPSMALDTEWPEFSAKARERGLASLLAFTLLSNERALGSLNLYATLPHAFAPLDRRIGAIFAAHAAVALANAQTLESARRRVDELLEGYANREVIGQAKGILMEREGCTEEEAFELLRSASSRLHRKLREVAKGVIHSTSEGKRPPPPR
ncbi:MAG TPA: ANTAR domain-containing protein [Actinomycetota bacterium]|nr:ANTAR domain-containing protein [Actinomycetota bacterium]